MSEQLLSQLLRKLTMPHDADDIPPYESRSKEDRALLTLLRNHLQKETDNYFVICWSLGKTPDEFGQYPKAYYPRIFHSSEAAWQFSRAAPMHWPDGARSMSVERLRIPAQDVIRLVHPSQIILDRTGR